MSEVSEANISRRVRELFDKGLVAMERNNLPYAMDMFMAALELEPRFFKCRKFLRASSIKYMNETRGGKVSHLATTLAGLSLLVRGKISVRYGDATQALGIAERLLRTDPVNKQFVRLLCEAALKLDMPEVAIHALNTAREFHQQDAALLQELGELYMQANQPDEARKCFEGVLSIRPHDGKAMHALKNAMARDTMLRGGWDAASSTKEAAGYRKVIKDVKEAAVLEADNKAVRDEHNTELLIRDTAAKVKAEPENINYRRALARLYVQAGRFEDAIHTLEEGRRLGGASDPQLDQALADVRIKQFDFEIAQCRENGDASGVTAKEKTKREFYFKDIKGRVERYPNDLILRFEFGKLLFENGQYNESIQQFQLAQRNPKYHSQALYYLGLCFMQKTQYDLAREQFEKVAGELPQMNDLKKEIYYQLGVLLEKTGNFDEAVEKYYKEVYQTDIGFKDVAAKIEKSYKKG